MIGISELLLIIVLGIILFKPEDYTTILKTVIQNYRRLQSTLQQTKDFILNDEIKKEIDDIRSEIISMGGKRYIKGDDGRVHEVFDIKDDLIDRTSDNTNNLPNDPNKL